MKKLFLILQILFFSYTTSISQVVGSWTSIVSYRNIKQVEQTTDKIFAVAENGIISLDKNTKEPIFLDKSGTLSSAQINTVKYDEQNNSLVVGYKNGKIDFVRDSYLQKTIETVYNNTSILNKTINDIDFSTQYIFFATDFGVIKANRNTLIFEELIKLSPANEETQCHDLVVNNDTLFVIAGKELMKININSNISFYEYWQKIQLNETPEDIACFQDYLLILTLDTINSSKTIYKYDKGQIAQLRTNLDTNAILKVDNDKIFILQPGNIEQIDINGNSLGIFNSYANGEPLYPNDILTYDGKYTTGDKYKGLVLDISSGESLFLNTPFADINTDISISGQTIAALAQTTAEDTLAGYRGIISLYHNNQWTWINTGIDSLQCVTIDPDDNTHIFAGSKTQGIIEIRNTDIVKHYTADNSILEKNTLGKTEIDYLLIDNDTLWIYNNSSHPVKYMAMNGESGYLQGSSVAAYTHAFRMIKTSENQIWATLGRDGFLACDLADGYCSKFYPLRKYGETPWLTLILDISEDQNQTLWAGGELGMGYVYDTDFANYKYVVWPTVEVEVNDTVVGFYLFFSTAVNRIKTDPANRKWVGSSNNAGVFLINEECTEQIKHFSQNNSPMPGNNIVDIEIEPFSGKVLIQTDKGLVSYISDASEGQNSFENLKIFPNPVRPGYSGNIIMEGLMDKTLIKITDIQGNVVTELRSQGGRAVWNLKNLNGQRVASGIYLIMCSTENNRNKCIKKLMIIN